MSNALSEDVSSVSLVAALEPTAKPQDVIAAAQADYARIVGLLYDRGYFAPVVSIRVDQREAAQISAILPPRSVSQIVINVQTGPPFVFGTARIEPLAHNTKPLDAFANNQPARTGVLREAVDKGIDDWRAQGHAKAKLAGQDINANHRLAQLNAVIRLNPGPKLRFGDLKIEGNERMREKRIRDIAGLPSGEIYSPDDLDRVAKRLRRTGVFSVVALNEADAIGPNDTLDIDAQLVENKLRRFGFAADISTQEGLGVSAYWLHRNLFGGAERLRISGEITGIGGDTGGEDYSLAVRFGRPATFNEDTDFYALSELSSANEPNFSSDRFKLEAGIRRYASERREYTLGFGFEAAETTDIFGKQSYRIFTIPLSATFDYRNDMLDATKGYYAHIGIKPFLNASGTSNGARTSVDLRAFHSIGASKRITLALRGQLGSVAGPALADAPADYLFYSGGGGTVRGQDFQSLGVDFGGGNVIGGRSFIGLSGEVRVKTAGNLGFVGFYDAGYIGQESFPDGTSGEWHSGAGVGVRYDTGIGPIRVDVAVPVKSPNNKSGFEVYIGIGQSF